MFASFHVLCSVFLLAVDGFHLNYPSLKSSKLSTATQEPQVASAAELKNVAWSPSSWQKFPIKQPPNYPDPVF